MTHEKRYSYYAPPAPKGWELRPLRSVAAYRISSVDKVPVDGEDTVRLCNYTDVYNNEAVHPAMELMNATATPDEISRFRLIEGDVLITKDSETWDDIAVPSLVTGSAPDFVCGYHLAIIRTDRRRLLGEFLFRCLQAEGIKQQFQLAAVGVTRYGIPKAAIGRARIPIPPIAEQQRVCTFIKSEVVQIGELIARKQRLIELLDEKEHALVSRAVTLGLDPRAPLRYSGVGWVGAIPAHWQVKAFKRLCTRNIVGIAEAATYAYADAGVVLVRSTNVTPNVLKTDDLLHIDRQLAEENKSRYLRPGDILTVRTGNAGVSAVVPPELDLSQCFTLLVSSMRQGNSSEFYTLYLNSPQGRHYFALESWGTAQMNISVPILQNLPCPVPPPEEQVRIALNVSKERGSLALQIEQGLRSIALLREYRSALITAAVTGELDIREHEERLEALA